MSEKSVKSRRKLQAPVEQDADADSDSSNDAPTNGGPPGHRPKLRHQKSFGWEVVEGLRDGIKIEDTNRRKPSRCEGYLLKRRKWPMKGWHKRYFVLDNGLLSYAKSPGQLAKGRYHGQVDVGLSVVSYKTKRGRIDIDADTIVHHIKINDSGNFEMWVSRLRWHRLFRQMELSNGSSHPHPGFLTGPPTVGTIERSGRGGQDIDGTDLNMMPGEIPRGRTSRSMSPVPIDQPRKAQFDVMKTMTLTRDQGSFKSQRSHASLHGSNRLLSWIIDSSIVDKLNKDISGVQSKLFDLNSLLQAIKTDPIVHPLNSRPTSMPTSTSNPNLQSLTGPTTPQPTSVPTSARADTVSVTGASQDAQYESMEQLPLRDVKPADSANQISQPTPSLDRQNERLLQKERFMGEATSIVDMLRTLTRTLSSEKEKIRQLLETQSTGYNVSSPVSTSYMQSLKNSLSEALMQNSELRMRLSRIRAEADIPTSIGASPSTTLHHSSPSTGEQRSMAMLSTSMSRDSITEFFDAPEYLQSTDIEEEVSTDSDGSDEDSGDSDAEEAEDDDEEEEGEDVSQDDKSLEENSEVPVIALKTGRRECLPSPQPDTSDFSLMNLLCRNIGRDLSRVRLPVILNEPLNALQRLCEEFEYSELLDTAAGTSDPVERMVYIAAFAVSGYTSSFYRSGSKPFNPLQGESYECIREDKGWKFIAEQVSHHPPISAMHCESDKWTLWQDLRIKNKFWGKSIEAVPMGTVNLKFQHLNEQYKWRKVTTCIHNIFGAQRYVEHYGEMLIEGKEAQCKLVFQKDNGWWGRRHEVTGEIWTKDKRRRQSVFGKWTEGLYFGQDSTARCVWRPGTMPEDSEIYYGFTRFAIELNHLDSVLRPLLPPTDSRLRPDQRLLEEGNVKEAEEEKMRVEEMQRQRRKAGERGSHSMQPKWFKLSDGSNNEEQYQYNGLYWQMRKDPGFAKISSQFPVLW